VALAGVAPVVTEVFGEIFNREMRVLGLRELEGALEGAEANVVEPVTV
jgi:hypothetical protein